MKSDYSIIIVNWNGGEMLAECLRSVYQSRKSLAVECVVIDNGSKDNSIVAAKQEFPQVRFLSSGGNVGFGRACNMGIEATDGNFVMFLNPDALLRDTTLTGIKACFDDSATVGALGCLIRDSDGTVQPLGIQRDPSPILEFLKMLSFPTSSESGGLLPRKDPRTSGPVKKLYGACLTIRRDVLKQIGGGFDDRFFMYCEDVDICRRIIAAGFGLYYLADIEILHNPGSCSRKAPPGFSTLMQCDSLEKYIFKYHGRLGALSYRALSAFGAMLRLIALTPVTAAKVLLRRDDASRWRKKWSRNNLTLRWSCFLAKPFIPD